MWYVKKTCDKDALTPTGNVFGAGKKKGLTIAYEDCCY
jgi:hypothetical protein